MQKKLEILSGPNGCGKTTLSEYLIEAGRLLNFVNADTIAKGLDASSIKGGEITAGKILLKQLDDSLSSGKNVSFETTLSGKLWVRLIKRAKDLGYKVNIYYIIVEDPEIAVRRIEERVSRGGHHIPRDTVLRRYDRSRDLLFSLYDKLVDSVFVFDNSNGSANLIAVRDNGKGIKIFNQAIFESIFRSF